MSSEIVNKLLLEDKKLREENKKLRKEIKDKLIEKLQKRIEKRKKEIVKSREIKTKLETKSKSKSKSKSITKPKPKSKQEIKTFDEYYQECIKNKSVPKDTPHYLKKALERAIKEYEKGIILEKSALANFAEKYIIEGKSGLFPKYYFGEKASQIKDFLRKYRNTKVRLLLVCEMLPET